MIQGLDHLNIRTNQLDAMIAWYSEVLGMTPGPRPDFSFRGAWMYANDQALVHLIGVSTPLAVEQQGLQLEHGAFRATDFPKFVAKLDARGERREILRVPGFPIVQVNVWDPDGNHLHIDFHTDEIPEGMDIAAFD